MLINMQLLPLETFLVSSGLRSTLFLALCSGDEGVPNHPPAQPLVAGGKSGSISTLCPPTTGSEVPGAALGRVTFFQAGVFRYRSFSLPVVRGSWSWVSAGKLFSTALWRLWGAPADGHGVLVAQSAAGQDQRRLACAGVKGGEACDCPVLEGMSS